MKKTYTKFPIGWIRVQLSPVQNSHSSNNNEKKTKYKYLGRAGSSAHIDAVEKLTRRNLIDELERVIQSLTESY